MSAQFNDRGPFKRGEVCYVKTSRINPKFNGLECVIDSGRSIDCHGQPCYRVIFVDGSSALGEEASLRRKRPPSTGEEKVLGLFLKSPLRELEPA